MTSTTALNYTHGDIDFANFVTSNDGSMPIDMTPGRGLEPMAESKNVGIGDQMKTVLSDLFAPANEPISYANIPWH